MSNSPRSKEARMSKSKIKTMLVCFFNSQGVVHKEFVPQGQTVNKQYYREVLERLKKGSSCPVRDCGHLDAASRQCSLSHCHLREGIFGQKRYFSGSAATILAWSESVRLLPFPKTQIPPQRSSSWNCGQHPKGRDRPAEGTSTWRLPALLPEWEQRLRRCVASEEDYFEGDTVDL